MKYLDSKNIFHPDLTPRMIMLDESYHPHFNISELINTSEPTIYTAPEILQGQPKNDKSDVYSFSLIAYELITGQRPNLSSDNILNNKQISKFLKQCLSKYPSKRPTFIEIFDEFMKDKYVKYFGTNKEIIYEYLSIIDEFSYKEILINLNEYKVVKKIGSGTFSEVFTIQNKNEKTKLIYTAKISKEALNEDKKSILRNLQREINIISKINHPNILKFIGFSPTNFYNEDKPVIVTEYMQNGTLQDIIKQERKSQSPSGWDDTKKLINIYGIAYAMSYLHSHGIIHRDLKPSNILLDEFLIPKIGDFGLSKFIQANGEENIMNNSSSDSIKGTPLYIAPEIYDRNEYSPSSDVYSFGLIVYEILTNIEPFDNIKPYQIPFKVTEGIRPEFRFPIPKLYHNLIEQCWSQEPSKRPTFDQILNELDHNQGFVTESIDVDDFHDFINYLKECEKSFNTNSKFIPINVFVKRKTKAFLPINIHEQKQLEYQGIQYYICNNKTTKIIKGCEINEKFKFPDYLIYNEEIYNIIEICDEAFSKSFAKHIFITHFITIKIPYNVEKIGKKCFEGLEIIEDITFSSSNLNIGERCFYNCKSLKSISFPNAQNLIFGSQCFKGCQNLCKISISRAQTIEIGESCFSDLKQLSFISFECKNLKVGSNCFQLCDSLESFSCIVSEIAFGLQPFDQCRKLNKVIIKSSSENQNGEIILNDSFFNDCSSLKYIEIDTTQSITILTSAFNGFNPISSIKLKSLSNITLSMKNFNTMRVQELEVKGKQVKFDDNCFYMSNELKKLIIESENLQVGRYCFNGCSNLKSFSVEKSTNIKLGSRAFSNCLKLENCNISSYYGPTIEKLEISDYCFSDCKSLQSIYFRKIKNAKIGSNAFEKCEKITRFSMIVSSKMEIGDYCFSESSNLKEVYLVGEELIAGAYLFNKCYSISSVTLRGSQNQNININACKGVNNKIIK